MRGANCAHDTFSDAGDDRFFSCATDEPIKMRTHRNTRFNFHADPVLRYTVNRRATHVWARRVDRFRINARAHRFQNRLAGALSREINGAGAVEIERNTGLVSGNQGEDHMAYITAGKVMRFQWIAPNIYTGLHRCDPIVHNQTDWNF